METYEDKKIRSQKVWLLNEKNDKKIWWRKPKFTWSEKALEKFMIQISNFEELECKKSLNINQ